MRNLAIAMGAIRSGRGFTLIEILVVVVIIGIVLSIAMLSLSLVGDDRDIRREGQRLMSILEVAQDDSVLQGREFGVEFLTGSYRFVEFDPLSEQWFEILGEDLLRTRLLPEEMEFELFLEDKRVLLDENAIELEGGSDDEIASDVRNYAPHILIFSSGDMTPFELHIRRITDQLGVDIRGDLLGNIEFETDEDEQYQ